MWLCCQTSHTFLQYFPKILKLQNMKKSKIIQIIGSVIFKIVSKKLLKWSLCHIMCKWFLWKTILIDLMTWLKFVKATENNYANHFDDKIRGKVTNIENNLSKSCYYLKKIDKLRLKLDQTYLK